MIYDLINMSDRYTFKADTLDCAAVLVVLLGNGQYGATSVDDKESDGVPIFLFGDAEGWFKSQFDKPIEKLAQEFLAGGRKSELVAALRSVLIGDRAEFEETLPLVKETDREKWIAARHERLRTSMNDIGKRAFQLADKINGATVKVDPVPAQVFAG